MLFQLRNFTWRTFAAGLFGLILPYLFNSVYIFFRGDWTGTMRFFNDYTTLPDAEDLLRMFNAHVLTIAAVGTLTLFAFIHFFHTSYNDKIKTRIFYYVAATQEVLLTAAVVLFPAKFDVTFSLWAANSALFLGRYYALGRGRLFNFWFYLSGILMVLLAAVNRLPL